MASIANGRKKRNHNQAKIVIRKSIIRFFDCTPIVRCAQSVLHSKSAMAGDPFWLLFAFVVAGEGNAFFSFLYRLQHSLALARTAPSALWWICESGECQSQKGTLNRIRNWICWLVWASRAIPAPQCKAFFGYLFFFFFFFAGPDLLVWTREDGSLLLAFFGNLSKYA